MNHFLVRCSSIICKIDHLSFSFRVLIPSLLDIFLMSLHISLGINTFVEVEEDVANLLIPFIISLVISRFIIHNKSLDILDLSHLVFLISLISSAEDNESIYFFIVNYFIINKIDLGTD